MKFNKIAAVLALFIPLAACSPTQNPTSEPTYTPVNDLERVFEKMQNNNFSTDITLVSINNQSVPLNRKVYYTPYSIETEGDFGFSGFAQDEDTVFRYAYQNQDVITGSPIINSNNGLRYTSLYDYRKSLQNFDISALPDEKGSDGYYVYDWGKNRNNDGIMLEIFLAMSSSSLLPVETKMKVIGNTIECKTVVLEYFEDENGNMLKDTIDTVIYNVGETENPIIKEYLDTGKTFKQPLDNKFHRVINSYFTYENYTVDIDASLVLNSDGNPSGAHALKKMTENAVSYNTGGGESGYVMVGGIAHQFKVVNDIAQMVSTPYADSDFNYFTGIVGQIEAACFRYLDHSSFVGYKVDNTENKYVLADSYLLSMLSSMCLIDLSDEMTVDRVIFEILDEENREFSITFEYYNRLTNRNLGTMVAVFKNHRKTSIPAVDRYLNKGDNPTTQNKQDIIDVLELFKKGNYSYDGVTGAGITKYYFTENYMIAVPYTTYNRNNNYGFIKIGNSIYEFNYNFDLNEVTIDKTVDYASGSNPMTLPGTGDRFLISDNDLGYISHLTEELYNYDNYEVTYQYGQHYWKNKSSTFSTTCFEYFKTYSNILPTGSGVIASKADNTYDTRLTIVSNFISNDGVYSGSYEFTFYDIGNTSLPGVDKYLENL